MGTTRPSSLSRHCQPASPFQPASPPAHQPASRLPTSLHPACLPPGQARRPAILLRAGAAGLTRRSACVSAPP